MAKYAAPVPPFERTCKSRAAFGVAGAGRRVAQAFNVAAIEIATRAPTMLNFRLEPPKAIGNRSGPKVYQQ